MFDPRTHRKQIKHIEHPNHARELTFSCFRRFPLLANDVFKQLLAESIDRAVERHGFDLVAFVFMPEHVHLIVYPRRPGANVSELLYALKRPHSFRVKQWMIEHDDAWLSKLTIRERKDKTVFRFWQEGPGYDRNIDSPETLLSSIEYLHFNPVKRGLCTSPREYRWSSWRHYHGGSTERLPKVHGVPS